MPPFSSIRTFSLIFDPIDCGWFRKLRGPPGWRLSRRNQRQCELYVPCSLLSLVRFIGNNAKNIGWQPPNPLKDGSAACSWNGKVYPDDGPAFPLPKSYTQITPNYTCLPSAGSYYEGKTNIEDLLASTVPCSARSAESSSSKLQSTTSLPRNISSHISSRISSRISSQNHNYSMACPITAAYYIMRR